MQFRNINLEEYEKIRKEIPNCLSNFLYFNKNIIGIFINDILVGLYSLGPIFGDYISIDILIFKEYRGHGLAGEVLNKIVSEKGCEFSYIPRFICMVSPKNEASNKVFKKLHWQVDTSLDEVILNEGSEYFYVYYQNNPYYDNKLQRKRTIENI